MLTPAEIWRGTAERLRDRLHDRDPDYDALRRAVRAAIVLPIAAALGFWIVRHAIPGGEDQGEIVIDERGQTSVPGVFAAGDCTTVPFKQIVIAAGAGATAALSAFDHLIRTTAPVSG